MKIFVAGPEEADSFSRNIIFTLRALGHEVACMPYSHLKYQRTIFRRGINEVLIKTVPAWKYRRERLALKITKEFNPDLTIVGTATLEPEVVHNIRTQTGSPVICWYGDSVANLNRNHVVEGEYDLVFLKDPDFCKRLNNVLGIDSFHLLEACNPEWHKPVHSNKNNSIVVAGNLYGYRGALVKEVLSRGESVHVYGATPPLWANSVARAAHTQTYLDHTNKAEIFGGALACLNSFAPSESINSLNCRVFETCGSGGVLLSEARPALDQCFDKEDEYLSFQSSDELIEQLRRLKKDKNLAETISGNASVRAHSEHTYTNRLKYIFKKLGME